MPGDDAAHVQNELSKRRESLALQHFLKNCLELWNDEYHQDRQNRYCDEYDGAGIKHRRFDLAANFLRLLHELRQAVQHDLENTAQLARFDHVYEKPVEHLWMLRKSFGKRAAAFDGQSEIVDHFLERWIFLLPFQHSQSTQQGKARVHERGQLPGKGCQNLRLDLPAQAGNFDAD